MARSTSSERSLTHNNLEHHAPSNHHHVKHSSESGRENLDYHYDDSEEEEEEDDADVEELDLAMVMAESEDSNKLQGVARIKGWTRTWRMILLTICLAGLQFTWSVEMAYGTPYLLSLGLSKSTMSLVWIAGPLSGLVMQPVIGAFSDSCTSKLGRRRPFMLGGCAFVVVTLLIIGWTREIGKLLTGGEDSTAYPKFIAAVGVASIYILDFSINTVQAASRALIVDSLPPSQQEEGSAWASRMIGLGAIGGYFMGFINLVAIFPIFGNTQLKVLCVIASAVLILSEAITCYAVIERVLPKDSAAKATKAASRPLRTFAVIAKHMWHLPKPVQRLCNVQFFAWMGWFPFSFYSTTWIAEIYAKNNADAVVSVPSGDKVGSATRSGSYAMLINSVISLLSSFLLPVFVKPTTRNTRRNSRMVSAASSASSANIFRRAWGRVQLAFGRVLPLDFLTLPRTWTASHFLFFLAMFSTFFVGDVTGATVIIAICGMSWAVSMWAPFSLLGEYITRQDEEVEAVADGLEGDAGMGVEDVGAEEDTYRLVEARGKGGRVSFSSHEENLEEEEIGDEGHPVREERRNGGDDSAEETRGLTSSGEAEKVGEINPPPPAASNMRRSSIGSRPSHQWRRKLAQRRLTNLAMQSTFSLASTLAVNRLPTQHELERGEQHADDDDTPSAGILLGIHNVYVVLPQFVVTFFSSVVFALLEPARPDGSGGHMFADTGNSTVPAVPSETGESHSVDSIAVVLRFGGLMAGVAGLLSIYLWKS
ncbi:uncharacterized protein VTP21DRAFT_10608 [Calcarisporiella thermophila]|uniref:uncharacterized protein n=1 Tax=Calcarisporiella thermophila TaxID=911321 RepID=UPI00374361D8